MAPIAIDLPLNGQIIRVCAARVLRPTIEPGDIVVWDNLLKAHTWPGPGGPAPQVEVC
jgi:hypothetical protein